MGNESSLTYSDIADLLALPYALKIFMATERIKEWYEAWNGQVYVSFSGGKDSCALLHLLRGMYPVVPAVFIDTGLQYPEVKEHVKQTENVTVIRPALSFLQVIERYGYPVISKEQAQFIYQYRTSKSEKLRSTRWNGNRSGFGRIRDKWKFLVDAPFPVSHKCCDVMKKRPAKKYERKTGRKPFFGTRIEESALRKQKFIENGSCNAFRASRPISQPLSLWTEQNTLAYIVENSISIPSVYGKILKENNRYILTGCQFTGCIFCAFGAHRETCPNRFQRLEKTHPELHRYCMERLGMREVLEYIGVPWQETQMQLPWGERGKK